MLRQQIVVSKRLLWVILMRSLQAKQGMVYLVLHLKLTRDYLLRYGISIRHGAGMKILVHFM